MLAAREMIDLVELFNQEQAAAKKPAIKIGVGIASGEMVAGYTGTHERATYTCVGNTVNLAARLEAYTKDAQRPILLDGATRAQLGDGVKLAALGSVTLKGVAAPVEVFAPE